MYRALHQSSGGEIIIIDPRWRAQIAHLRRLDKKDALVCPGCYQPVRVRAGKFKQAHFAHKHLQNCPYGGLSPRLLHTRAVLYDWLTSKFDLHSVDLEKDLGSETGIRPFDCWVEADDGNFAYWIFDRLMPPDERQSLTSLCAENELDVQWVFAIDLLRPDELTPRSRLHLTTTERAFIRQSELDQAWQTHFEQLGGSLHYLDPDLGSLISYRNLSLVHKPQLYSGKRLQNPLGEVMVSNNCGEFVHPGEAIQLEQTRLKLTAQQQQAEERQRRARDFLKGASFSKIQASQAQKPTATDATNTFERHGTCRICGVYTSDWVTYFGQRQECICRVCKDQVE